jgi:hypothetical protein
MVRRITTRPNKGMKQTKPAQAMELRSLSPVLGSPRVGASLPRPTLVPTTATTHRAYLTGLPVIGALSPSHVSKPCLSEPRTPRSSARRGHSAVSRSRVMVLGLGSSSGASLSTEAWLPVQTNIAQGRQGHPVQRRRPRGSTSGCGQDGAELRRRPRPAIPLRSRVGSAHNSGHGVPPMLSTLVGGSRGCPTRS